MSKENETQNKSTASQIAVLIEQMTALRKDVGGIKEQIYRNDVSSIERHKELHQKIDHHYVTQVEYRENKKVVDKRINAIENAWSWLIRLVFGLLIAGIVGYFTVFER